MADEKVTDQQQQEAVEADEGRAVLAQLIAKEELPRIRQRGLDDLDLSTHNRKPVDCERIEQLARVHSEKKGISSHSRPTLVRGLIDDALSAYAEHNTASATFIRELFFSPEDTTTPLSPGDLLDDARKKSGLSSGAFDRLRRKEFAKFSEFLANYVVRDTPISQETARQLYRVPKGYRLVRVRRDTWELVRTRLRHRLRTPIAMAAVIVLGLVLVLWYLIHRLTEDVPVAIGGKTTSTYQEPSTEAPKGPTIKAGQRAQPLCIATILQADNTPVYWVRLKSKPWTNYYVPGTALMKGNEQIQTLLNVGIPRCPTK
ncbi:hypothetical protein ACFXPN_45825 [Streptomyces griseorubiginosus]|uniref:hypothetical protein n=1 Tax=Streptomyces griseorubiginosus TaxID=67304 RepID=UPI0036CE5BEE